MFTLGPPLWGGAETDPYFGNVVLLMHMDGSNGGTSFLDQSLNTKTASRVGAGVTTKTENPKFGSAAAGGFDASSALTVANHLEFSFGTSDLTIECWFYVTSTTGNHSLIEHGNVGTPTSQKSFGIYTSGSGVWQVYFYTSSGTYIAFSSTDAPFSANQWTHLAVTRNGNTQRVFINGIIGGTNSGTFTIGTPIDNIYMGNYNGLAQPLNGLIDEVRITVGVGRYTANFTPPTAPFPVA